MKVARGNARWALSFADLCLLLLGFFVLMQARPDRARLSASIKSAFAGHAPATIEQPANAWFEPGEAVLKPDARTALRAFARGADIVTVSSHGTEPKAARFDGWELAAARAAAVAREVQAAGIPEGRVNLAIDPGTGGGQRIFLSRD